MPEASRDGWVGANLDVHCDIVPTIHLHANAVSSWRCGMPDIILALEILDMNIDSSRNFLYLILHRDTIYRSYCDVMSSILFYSLRQTRSSSAASIESKE
jgi:hypothetical protein